MNGIARLPVRYGRAHIPNGYHTWRAFTRRNHGVKWNSLALDKGIAFLVKAMSEAGILVTGGCDGHMRSRPRVYFASAFAAAWFRIIKRRYLNDLRLHYRWDVFAPEGADAVLSATHGDRNRWNVRLVQEDAIAIGIRLRELAPVLRETRRKYFKNRSMKQTALQLENDFSALSDWMNEKLVDDA